MALTSWCRICSPSLRWKPEKIKMHVENFDIVALAREVLDQLEDKAEKQKIDIQIEEPTARHFVKGDYRRIYQVLINLMSNAIKYTKKKGSVRIRFEEKDNYIITSVVDNGREFLRKTSRESSSDFTG